MKEERNRVLEGMQQWKESERMIADLFSPEVIRTKNIQQMKLEFMYELSQSVKGFMTKDEKIIRAVLSGEIDRLEKTLYPNLFIRLFVQLDRFISNLFNSSREIEKIKPYMPIVPEKVVTRNEKETSSGLRKETAKEIKIERNVRTHHKPLLEKKRNNHKEKALHL